MTHRHTRILSGGDSRNSGKCLTDTLGYSQEETQETQVKVTQTHCDNFRKILLSERESRNSTVTLCYSLSRNSGKSLTDTVGYIQEETQETQVSV